MKKFHDENFDNNPHAKLAALDSHVLIQYDSFHANAKSTQTDLVKTYMRCVFNIPSGREYVWTGFPSEPMLAEAAARLLNSSRHINEYAPEILRNALESGLLAKGERGELVARTLLTVAHDLAIIQNPDTYVHSLSEPWFHRPIRLLDLLKHLLAPKVWDAVRLALPSHVYDPSTTLENAFANAWVNFSHFSKLGDHPSFNLKCTVELLKRGTAIQLFDNHRNQDLALPIHIGDPHTTLISTDNTGICQWQIKNAEDTGDISKYHDSEMV